MVKCNTSLLSPREKRSIVRGVNKKYKDKNLTDEDMKHMIEEAMARAIKYSAPKRVYSVIQAKRTLAGREAELECADDFIPLSTDGLLNTFLETDTHCSAFELESSSEDKTTTSETGSVEDKGSTSERGSVEEKVDSSKEASVEEEVSTSGQVGSEHDSSDDRSSDEEREPPQLEPPSEDTSVKGVQESDSDSYEDLDDDDSIIGLVRRFCCGRRH
jgi:hypothetical protein